MYSLFVLATLFNLTPPAPTPAKIKTLYASLDARSVSQHLAFYELYPETSVGQEALKEAWRLLTQQSDCSPNQLNTIPFLNSALPAIIGLVNKQPDSPMLDLSDHDFALIDKLASSLSNRKLKGHWVKNEAELLLLLPEEIDLARGLLLTELGENDIHKIRSYETLIDLMALQIRALLPQDASPAVKIRAMNDFVFGEMGFRFPPHSIYAKDIDLYTFLPSVLDSRRGVCLGVSILYICLAQRLGLSLEMITPPGHIYVRYRDLKGEINIETTARGIHVDSEEYLSLETRSLQQRNVKEVIGLAHFNQASVFWKQEEYHKALESYQKAQRYLPNDKLLMELMGYTNLFVGKTEEGKKLLEEVRNHIPDYAITGQSIADDYLNGNVDSEGIKALFIYVDETHASIIRKRQALEKTVERYPKFRAGQFQLATTWLQLHREPEALAVLQRYHRLDPYDPTAEYYLSVLYGKSFDFNNAWDHLRRVEQIVKAKNYAPKQLKILRRELALLSPE
jgi:regulator of sirC expression with transglutaminase-like and TPR domain